MTETKSDAKPVRVPEGAKQAGEDRSRWEWVEPTVWTERMLTALEKGVKGGKWFSLIDKVARSVRCGRRLPECNATEGLPESIM